MSGNMIDVAWNMTVLDIESTLRASIGKIFRDRSVDEKGKKQRAKALLKLSKIYEGYGEESDKGLDEMKEMIKGQMKNAPPPKMEKEGDEAGASAEAGGEPWACKNCTFKNAPGHLACEMCG